MRLSKGISVVSFVGALVIGIAASTWFVKTASGPVAPDVQLPIPMVHEPDPAPVRARNLLGRWKGSWNYWGDTDGTCTIHIDRVNGDRFYGTLTQGGAEVTFEGKFDAVGRKVFFHETKVIKLGQYSQWFLGTYNGSLSDNGRILSGSGKDSWNGYDWNVTKVQSEGPEN
jgi:hypothetical protein